MVVLRLFGPVDLRDDSGRELRQLLGQPKRLALLAYLAGNAPQQFHRRDRLLALFWPESTADQARHGLRQVLYALRNQFGENAILSRGADEIALNQDIVRCDVAQLHSAVAAGDLDRAVELYRGDFLDGFFLSKSPEVEQWIEDRRAELHRRIVEVSWKLVAQRENQNDIAGAVSAAHRAVALSPADEAGVRKLLSLLKGQQNIGEALRVYERLVRTLAGEFDAKPSPETTALIASIREVRGGDDSAQHVGLTPVDSPSAVPELPTSTIASTKSRVRADMLPPTLLGISSVVILGAVYVAMVQLGLPEWVLTAAVGLVIIGLPIIVATALSERHRIAHPDRPRSRWLTWRKATLGGSVAFTALALSTTGFMGMRALGIGPVGTLMAKGVLEARDPILLAEFDNRTSDSTLAATITQGLRIDLSQSRVVRLVEAGTVNAALERMVVDPDAPLDEELARQVAEREGIKAVLTGEVASVGAGYMLAVRLLSPVDGALLSAVRVTADNNTQLIAAMDKLSARLRERIGESLKDVRASPPLERVTTSSLEALRKFTQAVHLDEQEGDPARALPLLEDAVALDPTFAMAYRKLGNIVGGLQGTEASRTAVRRAFELRDRLPERERYLIEAYYYSPGGVDFNGAKLAAAYRSALMLDPDDYIALNNLSGHLKETSQWAEAESLALRAVEVSGIWQAYISAVEAQLLQGKFDDAQATIDRYAEVNPGHPRATHWQARVAIAKREYDLAEQVLREGVSNPNLPVIERGTIMHWLGDLLRLRGRIAEARQWYRDWMTLDYGSRFDFQATYHVASLEAEYGSQVEALQLLDSFRLDSLSPVQPPHLLLAESFARAGQVDRAEALLAQFEERVEVGIRRFPTYQQVSRQIAGEIALREDRFDDAAADFAASHELGGPCMTCGLSRLAYSLEQNGREDSALAVYQQLVAATVQLDGVHAHLDTGIRSLRGLPESYRRLGELYEARNDTTQAVNAYNEFVELWKDADPELQPQVADVRRRITNMRGELPIVEPIS